MSNGAKVSLIGRLTKDPTSKTWEGRNLVTFTLAVNTVKKDANDKYLADFYNVSAWGNLAEFILPRIKKGMLVSVHGEQMMQTYKDKNGTERMAPNVRANDITPLEKKKDDDAATTEAPPEFPF